ncbi:MAG: hypothetical protein ACK5D5_14045 [Bacteroidota bacterium]|jgi:hypothetical protein
MSLLKVLAGFSFVLGASFLFYAIGKLDTENRYHHKIDSIKADSLKKNVVNSINEVKISRETNNKVRVYSIK